MATVTGYDRMQGYELETLSEALASDQSSRHVARIAHLYLSRTAFLTDQDYTAELPVLFDRIFGTLTSSGAHLDHGWLARIKEANDCPRSLGNAIRRSLDATFDMKKFSRDALSAFRVFQLLDTSDRGNLFEVVFQRQNRPSVYFLRLEMLPGYARQALQVYLQSNGSNSMMLAQCPEMQFYASLSMATDLSFYTDENARKGIALGLEEFFVFRFLCWFVFAPLKDSSLFQSQQFSSAAYSSASSSQGFSTSMSFPQSSSSSSSSEVPKNQNNAVSSSSGSNSGGLNSAPANSRNSSSGPSSRSSLSIATSVPHVSLDFHAAQRAAKDLSTCHVHDLVWKNPALEILKGYLEALLPLDVEKIGTSGILFFQSVLHLWLLRNFKPEQTQSSASSLSLMTPRDQSITSTRGYGSATFTASRNSTWRTSVPFIHPTLDFLKGLTVFLVYLQTDKELSPNYPSLSSSGDLSGALVEFRDAPASLRSRDFGMFGTTHYLKTMQRSVHQFFWNSLQKTSKKGGNSSASFLDVVNVWLTFLEPWKAAFRWKPRPGSRIVQHGLSALTAGVKAAVRSPTRESSSPTKGVENLEFFGAGWMWYVIQHYLMYAHLLQVAFARFKDFSLNKEDQEMIEKMLAPKGPFCDPIIAILRACEVILEDAELGQPARALATEVTKSYAWMSKHLDRNSLDSARANEPRAVEGAQLNLILDCMEANRPMIYNTLKQHMSDLNWNIEERLIPAILDSQSVVKDILKSIYDLESRQKRRTTVQRAEAAFEWIGKAFQAAEQSVIGAPGPAKVSGEKSRGRLHEIFRVPGSDVIGALAGKEDLGSKVDGTRLNDAFKAPLSDLMLGTPKWFKYKAYFVYRQLTALGKLQLSSGERACTNENISFVGDPLMNPPPICSYEIAVLVHVFHALSLYLNSVFGLDEVGYKLDDSEREKEFHWVETKFRFNLRFLADARNLLFGLLLMVSLNTLFLGLHINILGGTFGCILIAMLSTSDDVIFYIGATIIALIGSGINVAIQ